MAYRDDREQLRVRVAELEDELKSAREQIRVLEGTAPRGRRGFGELLTGAPLRLLHERVIDGELSAKAHEEIVEALRRRFGALGQASTVGRTLAWSNVVPQGTRAVEISVSARDGKTTVRGMERMSNLAGGLFGGIVGGVGGGGMAFVIPLVLAVRIPALMPIAVLAWVLAVYGAVRVGFARAVAVRDRELQGAVNEIASIVEAEVTRAQAAKVRVGAEHGAEADDPPEEELEPEAPPRRARRD
jgi:hypothetical protein